VSTQENKMSEKPVIIVTSKDDDTEGFKWYSDGWNHAGISHTPEAQDLMAKAHEQIVAGENVLDVIRRLKEVGFEIVRT
jgi:hypothetical protein